MNQSILPKLFSEMKKYPVTWFFFILIVGLFLATIIFQMVNPDESSEAQRRLGALSILKITTVSEKSSGPDHYADLNGPFELWEGEYWRILVSGFHHGGLFHLFCNGLSLLWLGKLLEPVMKKWVYFLFIITASYVSFLPEILLGHNPVGFSGALCGMIGLIFVLRKHDVSIENLFDDNMVRTSIYFLLGCVIATQLEIIRIANVAHFTGLGYGILFGVAFWGVPKWNLTKKQILLCGYTFLLAHLLIIPGTYYCVHPDWNGRYQWYQAVLLRKERQKQSVLNLFEATQNKTIKEELSHLKKAVAIDPGLAGAWVEITTYYFQEKNFLKAWETILTGLQENQTDETSAQLALEIWQSFLTTDEHKEAMDILVSIFGDDSKALLSRFKMLPGQSKSIESMKEQREKSENATGILEYFKGNRFLDENRGKKKKQILDPPDEAVEGTLL